MALFADKTMYLENYNPARPLAVTCRRCADCSWSSAALRRTPRMLFRILQQGEKMKRESEMGGS